jgi:hypothetical protein
MVIVNLIGMCINHFLLLGIPKVDAFNSTTAY